MAKFSTDKDVKDVNRGDSPELIPAGNYLTEIDRVTHFPAKDGKAAALLVSLRVLDAEDEDQKKYKDATFLDNVTLHDNAAFRYANFADAVFGRQVEGTDFDTDDFLEKKVKVQVFEDEYQGDTRSKVKRYFHVSQWRGDEASSTTDDNSVASTDEVDL